MRIIPTSTLPREILEYADIKIKNNSFLRINLADTSYTLNPECEFGKINDKAILMLSYTDNYGVKWGLAIRNEYLLTVIKG